MDYTNLMVGDWVRFRNDYPQKELQGKIAKVRGINGRVDVRTLDGEYHESEHPNWLEPIPITSKILFKNGFLKKQLSNEFLLFHGADKVLSLYDEDEGFVTGEYKQMTIHCVHELQHLLKLCGIKEEITL